ncbi:hypothetical protein AYJ54_31670 [Bradyrhizobium centrolobii]|uniref:Uncharacterized protein n=1 Tax=Bradyrhizobium centrolobii TaxID=1505087 RepID=A0A176YAQ6_9BRAD|nr:hypothetical protein AYJ54_31670 [Bradyrhizobium centrolobii]
MSRSCHKLAIKLSYTVAFRQIDGRIEQEVCLRSILRRQFANCFSTPDIQRMTYDSATVHMLRDVLDEVLASASFTQQQHRSAVEVAERILWLASQGERERGAIKRHLLNEFLESTESSYA